MNYLDSTTETRWKYDRRQVRFLMLAFCAMTIFHWTDQAMAIEEPQYTIALSEDIFEVRDYSTRIVAETSVTSSFEKAGTRSFDRLFGYISGDNALQQKISMTAPVSQNACHDATDKNVATGTDAEIECWRLSFTMPSGHTMGSLPDPTDPDVGLRMLPPARYAVIRYSGFWSESAFQRHKERLESWISRQNLTVAGDATWARYNSPFTPWFLRRNEILIPISGT